MRLATTRASSWVHGACSAVLLAALAGCGESEPVARPAPQRPDIVVVLIDTLRVHYLGLGEPGAGAAAPFLSELAGRSILFRHAFSTSSWTAPATALVFTGLYPTVHGVTEGIFAHKQRSEGENGGGGGAHRETQQLALRPMPEALATLPERLRAAGYQTLGVASNVNIGPELGFARGFERFHSERQASAESLAGVLRAWHAELDAARPSFVYVHLNDVHKPHDPRAPWYQPPADARDGDADERARYLSEVRYVDEVLRALARDLDWGPETALVVLSDHGEAFGDHGMRGHGFSLYDELNRVLLLLAPPGWSGGARVVDENVSLLDVRPTVLALAGLAEDELPGAVAALRGRSLLPLVQGDADAQAPFAQRTLFAHRGSEGDALWGAIRGDWKLIENPRTGQRQLFDLGRDPQELDDRLAREPQVAASLAGALDGLRAVAHPLGRDSVNLQLDAETLRHLAELGYVSDDGAKPNPAKGE